MAMLNGGALSVGCAPVVAADMGNTWFSFLSSTIDFCATSRARDRCAAHSITLAFGASSAIASRFQPIF